MVVRGITGGEVDRTGGRRRGCGSASKDGGHEEDLQRQAERRAPLVAAVAAAGAAAVNQR